MQLYIVQVGRIFVYTSINRRNQTIVYTYTYTHTDDTTCTFDITNHFDVIINHEICDKEKEKRETIRCVHSTC